MKHTCARCEGPLKSGQEVVQMFNGIWDGAITPKVIELFAEWHRECFRSEFPLIGQARPYKCETCGKKVESKERINFFLIGQETSEHYIVAESRGYNIFTVKHYGHCVSK
jgi:hypothetical protein